MKTTMGTRIAPENVHETLNRHMLVDGYPIVLDLDKSHGRQVWDSHGSRWYLDMFSCFATLPVGLNHPGMKDEQFQKTLLRAAITNPANSDMYTVEMAEFVEAFERLSAPDYLPWFFFVAGGSLAVENAMKTAFDWKVRRNERLGVAKNRGYQILHFREAFHGRSGYTLPVTNTSDPRKYEKFPLHCWPRVSNPKLRFPIDAQELERVQKAEADSIAEIEKAFRENEHDIAGILIEPIQGEGGDNHFRPEYLQKLRDVCDENHALLIFDEVQTGMGLTGRMWAHERWDIRPDIVAFGKKTQVCGIMAGRRIEDEPENVFNTSSRINSTWGGNLVDMVRCQRYLEIMHAEKLVENADTVGGYLLEKLQDLQSERPDAFSNARGQGLMCAIDFTTTEARDMTGARGVRRRHDHPAVRRSQPALPPAARRHEGRDRRCRRHPEARGPEGRCDGCLRNTPGYPTRSEFRACGAGLMAGAVLLWLRAR